MLLEFTASPVNTMKTYMGTRDMAPLIHNLDTTFKHWNTKIWYGQLEEYSGI
jgi:hypothetical protein